MQQCSHQEPCRLMNALSREPGRAVLVGSAKLQITWTSDNKPQQPRYLYSRFLDRQEYRYYIGTKEQSHITLAREVSLCV